MGVADAGIVDLFKKYMQREAIKAGQFALHRNGTLVMSVAFTWAEPGYPVTEPKSLMRIASCSKAFTTAAKANARAFFERWKQSLKWQRLKPYERFAVMIEKHWDGIAAYCNIEEKVSLGLVEGLNNKIKVLQRRAYGYRDEDYLKLKIVAAFLPPLPRNASRGPL